MKVKIDSLFLIIVDGNGDIYIFDINKFCCVIFINFYGKIMIK